MKKVSLEDVCNCYSSNISQKDIMLLNGDYPVYGASGKIKNINFYKCDKSYIGIVKDGAGIGRTMILPGKSSIISTMQYILPKNNINIRYLYYAIKNMDLARHRTGITIPHIYFKDYKKEEIYLPTLEEQIKVANELDKTQTIIDIRKGQIKELDELIKSKFAEMFENIEKCKLSDIAIITMGQSPNSSTYNDNKNGIPFFQGKADFGDTYVKINHYCNKPTKIAVKDDVLISVRAPVGAVNITKTKCCIGRGLASIRCIDGKSTTWFLYHSLKTMEREIQAKGTGSTFKAIGKDTLYNLEVPNIKIEEQNRFVDIVKQIDKQKIEIQKSLERLEELMNSLMNKYFGGSHEC